MSPMTWAAGTATTSSAVRPVVPFSHVPAARRVTAMLQGQFDDAVGVEVDRECPVRDAVGAAEPEVAEALVVDRGRNRRIVDEAAVDVGESRRCAVGYLVGSVELEDGGGRREGDRIERLAGGRPFGRVRY